MILLYILRKRVPIIREHIVYYIERRGWAARPRTLSYRDLASGRARLRPSTFEDYHGSKNGCGRTSRRLTVSPSREIHKGGFFSLHSIARYGFDLLPFV